MEFSKKLKQLISDGGYTQTYVEKKTKIPQPIISLFVTGKREPTHQQATILANFFGVSVEYLMGKERSLSPHDKIREGLALLQEGLAELKIKL